MSETPPGWYRDDDDHQLARWWDGHAWTADTVAIGDVPLGAPASTRFPRPGAAGSSPTRDLDPDPWARDTEDDQFDPSEFDLTADLAALPVAHERLFQPDPYRQQWDDEVRHEPTFADRVRDWPTWTRVVAPIALVALMVLAVAAASSISSRSQNETVDTSTTSTTAPSTTTEVTYFPAVTTTAVLDTTTSVEDEPTDTTTRRRTTATTKPKPATTFTVPTIPTTTQSPTTTTMATTTTTAPPETTTSTTAAPTTTTTACVGIPGVDC